MTDYRLGLYEKALPAGMRWEEMLTSARDAGFDFLEISIDETDARLARLDWTEAEREMCLRAMRESGVPIHTMCLSGHRRFPLGSHDAATRARGIDILQKAVRLACDLGIRVIQLAGYDVYYEDGDAQTRALFAENLRGAVKYAAQYGVPLGFETMETPFLDTVKKGMEHVRAVDSPYLGMYPDLGNLTNAAKLYGTDVIEDLRDGKGRLFAMHLKATEPGKYRDMRFGEGHVDFPAGIRAAKELGVRMFVAECWHDGGGDWRDVLSSANAFLRRWL